MIRSENLLNRIEGIKHENELCKPFHCRKKEETETKQFSSNLSERKKASLRMCRSLGCHCSGSDDLTREFLRSTIRRAFPPVLNDPHPPDGLS